MYPKSKILFSFGYLLVPFVYLKAFHLGHYIFILRSYSDILTGRFVFANSDRGEISHHHLTIVDLSVGVTWPPKGMVG